MKVDTRHPAYVLLFAAALSAVLTAGIVSLQVATAARVERNERMRQVRALATLFAPAWGVADIGQLSDPEVLDLVKARVDRSIRAADPVADADATPPGALPLYRAYAGAGRERLVGLAFPAAGNGFWARIEALVAVTPDAREVLGLVVTDQGETPGLGGRIMEPEFAEQFSREARRKAGLEPLRAAPPAAGGKFLYVGRGRPAGPSDPRFGRSVDAVTGATQTSLAVERLLNENLARLHGAAAPSRDAGETAPAPAGAGRQGR